MASAATCSASCSPVRELYSSPQHPYTRHLIASLPRSLSILMIEHDMKVVFSLADRITVLYYGEVLASGAPADIQANARVREVYLGMVH